MGDIVYVVLLRETKDVSWNVMQRPEIIGVFSDKEAAVDSAKLRGDGAYVASTTYINIDKCGDELGTN